LLWLPVQRESHIIIEEAIVQHTRGGRGISRRYTFYNILLCDILLLPQQQRYWNHKGIVLSGEKKSNSNIVPSQSQVILARINFLQKLFMILLPCKLYIRSCGFARHVAFAMHLNISVDA